jgi:hypothetical protein
VVVAVYLLGSSSIPLSRRNFAVASLATVLMVQNRLSAAFCSALASGSWQRNVTNFVIVSWLLIEISGFSCSWLAFAGRRVA